MEALNRCRMQRPMVSIDQVPWNEICDEELVARLKTRSLYIELELRRKIYMWKPFPVDVVLEPHIIPKIVGNAGYGLGEDQNHCITRHHRTIKKMQPGIERLRISKR